jgi:hypothetical protein
MGHETYVGITHTLPENSRLTVAILHPGNQTVIHGSWNVVAEAYDPFEVVNGDMRLKPIPPALAQTFRGAMDLMKSRCGASTRILIEYPAEEIAANSIFSQFVATLIREGFGASVIDFRDDSKIIHFREISTEQRPPSLADDQVFLANGKAKALAMALFDCDTCTDQQHATAAALIAMNPYLYYFLKSRGEVFSSQDIALFLKDPESMNPLVISGETFFFISMTPVTRREDFDDLHLEFALAQKRFSFLPSGEALKFTVLSVCKQLGLRLHCASINDPSANKLLDDERLAPNECVVYEPEQPFPSWIVIPKK